MGIFDSVRKEIDAREKQEGITPADLLDLSEPLRKLMTHITRQGDQTVAQAAELMGEPPGNVRQMLDALVEKGYLEREETEEGWIYRTRFAHKRGRDIPVGIWSALDKRTKDEKSE